MGGRQADYSYTYYIQVKNVMDEKDKKNARQTFGQEIVIFSAWNREVFPKPSPRTHLIPRGHFRNKG